MINLDDNQKIKRLEEGIRIKKRLNELGIFGIVGPQGERGPKGDAGFASIEIGEVETVEPDDSASVENVGTSEEVILNFKIPRGFDGKEGEIGPTGPKGEKGDKGDAGPRGLPGEIGISENIVIDATETLEAGEDAMVMDDFDRNVHHLTFYIPKGETGPQGLIGETGATGPTGPTGPAGAGVGVTAYNAILFTRYADTTDAKSLTIREKTFIPDPTNYFSIPSTINIDVKFTGIYEITLCGKISGVTEDNGASFYLWNTVTGSIINNLTFSLNEGTTREMNFSGTTITQIFAPATLQVKTVIINDASSSKVKFTDINLVIKRYNS